MGACLSRQAFTEHPSDMAGMAGSVARSLGRLVAQLNGELYSANRVSESVLETVAAALQTDDVWLYLCQPGARLELAGSFGQSGNSAYSDLLLDTCAALAAKAASDGLTSCLSAGVLRAQTLCMGEEMIGVLVFRNDGRLELEVHQREAVTTALSMALWGMKARCQEKALLSRLEHVTRTVYDLVDRLSHGQLDYGASFDLQGFLTLLAYRARELTGAEVCAIGFGGDSKRPFAPVGTLGGIAVQGETPRSQEAGEHAAPIGFARHHPKPTNLLGVPISFRGESLGNLYLANKPSDAEFSEEDQRVVELLAALAATGLGQAMLLSWVERERRGHL